jgi:hypothetical protein
LEKFAEKFMQDPVRLVVATGGVVALEAAVYAAGVVGAKIPIIYIIGHGPIPGLTDYPDVAGGINLNMPGLNGQKVTELRGRVGNPNARVALLVNTNSEMGPYEAANAWDEPNWGPVVPVGVADENNDNIDLRGAAAQLNRSDAAVVSGDPYFMSQRRDLVDALNGNDKWICYPFSEYLSFSNDKSFAFAPNLGDEYENLGKMARQILEPHVDMIDATPVIIEKKDKPRD